MLLHVLLTAHTPHPCHFPSSLTSFAPPISDCTFTQGKNYLGEQERSEPGWSGEEIMGTLSWWPSIRPGGSVPGMMVSFLRREGDGGLRTVFLPAWMWIQAMAFLSRSSHSHFMSLPLSCSQSTTRTVAQLKESASCTTDRDATGTPRLAESPSRGRKKLHSPLTYLPQTANSSNGPWTLGQQSTVS